MDQPPTTSLLALLAWVGLQGARALQTLAPASARTLAPGMGSARPLLLPTSPLRPLLTALSRCYARARAGGRGGLALFVRANLQHHDTVFMKEVINHVGRALRPSGSRKVWSPGVFVSLTLQNQLPRWPKLRLGMRKKSGAAVLGRCAGCQVKHLFTTPVHSASEMPGKVFTSNL